MARARVLVDADVRTMEGAARADAIAWRDGAIVAVGTEDAVRAAVDTAEEPEVTRLGGATVVPGFIDAHHHACIGALYGGAVRLTPPSVTTIEQLQRALAGASKALAPGEWLVATDWDELLLDERRPPTLAELDDAVPDRPLFALHYSCHRGLANARALEQAGIDRATPDPAGGAIARGAAGAPNGLLVERGMSRVESLARASLIAKDAEGFFERLARHHAALAAVGITRVVDAAVPLDALALLVEAARRGALTVPTVAMPTSTTGWLQAPWDVLEAGAIAGHGDLVTVGPIKLIFDGAPACAMCLSWWQVAGVAARAWAMALGQRSLDVVRATMSVAPRVGAKVRTGIQIYGRDEAREVVGAIADRGMGVAAHAIGNEAIAVALEAFEAIGPARLARAGTPRVEHATFVDAALVARLARAGAAVVTQPAFVTLPAFASAPSVPGMRAIALRWLLDAGVPVAGSSDWPVAGFDPLEGLRAAVTRRTRRVHAYEPDQRVTLDEALAMYTRVAAQVSGCADRCGTLATGKRADLVVIDRRLARDTDLEDARVRATVIGGALAFGALAAP